NRGPEPRSAWHEVLAFGVTVRRPARAESQIKLVHDLIAPTAERAQRSADATARGHRRHARGSAGVDRVAGDRSGAALRPTRYRCQSSNSSAQRHTGEDAQLVLHDAFPPDAE